MNFDIAFEALTGHPPFPWQRRLYKECFTRGEFPACSLPTGLGKTSVMAVWLLALAASAEDAAFRGRVPRRLAYVVNRRTIVDQATREAEKLHEKLKSKPELRDVRDRLAQLRGEASQDADQRGADVPLAISTLRGQFADNGEWAADPARPAIIVGTVDMIGSRLLFSGYGVGRNRKPMHAGFLGQGTLLVHDEAHLEPAFQRLIETITAEQERHKEFERLRVMPLTATPRMDRVEPFELDKEDREHPIIKQRIEAKKTIELHRIDDEMKTAEEVAALAVKRAEASPPTPQTPGAAILVFVRKVEDVKKAVEAIGKAKGIDRNIQIEQLTGTLRGLERDALIKKPVFQRFLPESNRDKGITLPEKTVFLVCTSAGEVGVDISADHLVCDLTTFDSMAQRFGRVNRYGVPPNNAIIDIVHPKLDDFKKDDPYDDRRKKTLALLKELDGNGSPKAIDELPIKDRIAAFSPDPKFLDATDILFDAWALTSIGMVKGSDDKWRDALPGRPAVEPYLHGVANWEPPETHVAWRADISLLAAADGKDEYGEDQPCSFDDLEEVFDAFPLRPAEQLRDRTNRVQEQLEALAARLRKVATSADKPQTDDVQTDPDSESDPESETDAGDKGKPVPLAMVPANPWVVLMRHSAVRWMRLSDLTPDNKQKKEEARRQLAFATIVLPVEAGGLKNGMLDGTEPPPVDARSLDVAEVEVAGQRSRQREVNGVGLMRSSGSAAASLHTGFMVPLRKASADDDDESAPTMLEYRVAKGEDQEPGEPVSLATHNGDAARVAERMAMALGLEDSIVRAIAWRAGRRPWQGPSDLAALRPQQRFRRCAAGKGEALSASQGAVRLPPRVRLAPRRRRGRRDQRP